MLPGCGLRVLKVTHVGVVQEAFRVDGWSLVRAIVGDAQVLAVLRLCQHAFAQVLAQADCPILRPFVAGRGLQVQQHEWMVHEGRMV